VDAGSRRVLRSAAWRGRCDGRRGGSERGAGSRRDEACTSIRELTQEHETDGLIIDFRLNRGGNMFLSDAGLGMLFDRPVATIGWAERADPSDHLKMRHVQGSSSPNVYVIDTYDHIYDRRPTIGRSRCSRGRVPPAPVTRSRCA
jgi:hypothetical protein